LSRLQALEHLRAGRPQVALGILQSELRQQPADAQGWFLLGACHDALSEYSAAANALSRSLALNPANIEAQLAYMSVLRASGDLANALMASQKALAESSDDPRLLYAAALCYDDVGRVDEALAHYEAALRRAPGMEDALHNRGLLLSRLGRLEEAESNQRRYVEAHPGAARAHAGLADMLIAQRRFAEALEAIDNLERLSPEDISARVRRGIALASLRRFQEAREIFADALTRDRQAVERYLQRIAPGAHLRYLLSAKNIFLWQSWLAMGQCDWTDWDATVAEIQRLPGDDADAIDPALGFMALHLPLTGKERHEVSRRIATHIESNAPALPAPPPRSRARIRVGVLSPDLREHIMGHLLLPLFELLDRKRFDLYAYALIPEQASAIGARLRAATHAFRDLHLASDEEAAAQVRADDIDILIDAGGYTTGGRSGITARRAARIQALYLGFAGSLGSRRVDNVISDPVVSSSQSEWSETPVHLPHTYYLYDFREQIPDVPVSRKEYGLPEDAFVYCAFHRPEKISPDTFLLWMQILRQVPRAALWLLPMQPVAQRNLRRSAAAQGVAAERLVFAPFEPRHDPRYLARHRLGDLMLDALHHNAIATAGDALATALPMITVKGAAMASRSGESLLRAAGLPELVAADKAAYVELAVQLAADRERLNSYRRTLQARSAPLFDTAGRVRELEVAFLEMWRRYEQRD
jgi:predicted O-linked N-acetylglucosamine transferase (SPINDLY family)